MRKIITFNRKKIKEKGSDFYNEFLSREPEQIAVCADPAGIFFIFSSVIAAAAAFISLQYSYSFFIIFPVTGILYIMLDKIFAKLLERFIKQITDINYKAEPQFINYINNAKTISKFGNINFYFSNLNEFEKNALKIKNKYLIIKSLRTGLAEIISSLSFIMLVCILCFDITAGKLTFGSFVILLSYFSLMLMPLLYHGQYKMKLIDAEGAMSLFNDIEDECKTALFKIEKFSVLEKNKLKADKVCFSYSVKNNTAEDNMDYQYKDISFSISDGDRLGFVGVSGEGKSTIVKLLLGELTPQSGKIEINGTEVSKLPQFILDYLICVYEQTSVILPGTLYENICLGRDMVTDEEYDNAFIKILNNFSTGILQKRLPAGLADMLGINAEKPSYDEKKYIELFFNSSPNPEFLAAVYRDSIMVKKSKVDGLIKSLGIQYLHGRNLGDNGAEVSGGEKERIAMARFLTKEHASLYIIDEPFTSLDTKTEKECLDFLCNEIRDKNVFVISHKFNVLKSLTKRCIVMKNGTIIEEGTHEDLEQKQGLYYELLTNFNMQRKDITIEA